LTGHELSRNITKQAHAMSANSPDSGYPNKHAARASHFEQRQHAQCTTALKRRGFEFQA
jgi:hypothetical protein